MSEQSLAKDGTTATLKKHIADVTSNVLKVNTSRIALDVSPETARKQFNQFAHCVIDDTLFMTKSDFLNAITLPFDQYYHKFQRQDFGVLFDVTDTNDDGLISVDEWVEFHGLLQKPDFEYRLVFKLFDSDSDGTVSFETFKRILTQYKRQDIDKFDFNSKWLDLYMGERKYRHELNYNQFSQMLHGLLGERVRQAFQKYDSNGDGYITPDQFAELISTCYSHKLSDYLLGNLRSFCNVIPGNKISYSTVRAFQNVVNSFDIVSDIVKSSLSQSSDNTITKLDFVNEAATRHQTNVFTPLEIEILFHFAGIDNSSGKLSLQDFERIMDSSWQPFRHYNAFGGQKELKFEERHKTLFLLFESIYNFGLGAIAGGVGATAVYPIDLVKTRMQNQRSKIVGELLYKNSWDCAKKVVRNEGFFGLYSGLLPQLLGVAPEKAIKLTVNDFIRGKTKEEDGSIALKWEILAGASAGGCQVSVTNPLEVVKIQLQVRGQVQAGIATSAAQKAVPHASALSIVKSLGLVGLYKGAVACLLRDIPFSAIYFPTYAHLKKDWYGERPDRPISILQMLISGAVAGMPAAYLTTPADVIKTRLQVKARHGETVYVNIRHAFATILKEEGIRAFFKGGLARVLRSSPQFGVTLASYEFLQKTFPVPGHKTHIANKDIQTTENKEEMPLSFIRARNSLSILRDLGIRLGDYSQPMSKL